MSYTIETFENEKMKMQYIRFGTGEKTLVIIPGISLGGVIPYAAAIEKQYEIFSKDFTVFVFERRENMPETYTVYDIAEDTATVINSLGLKNICLFGVSQGGMVSMLIASHCVGLVSKLVLGSTAYKVYGKGGDVIGEWISLVEQKKTLEFCYSFGEKVYSKEVFEQNKSAFRVVAKMLNEDDLNHALTLAKGTLCFNAENELKNIQCPVFVIGDTEDKVFGKDSSYELYEKLKKDNQNASLFMYEGYGHAVYDTAPDYTEKLYEFFIG